MSQNKGCCKFGSIGSGNRGNMDVVFTCWIMRIRQQNSDLRGYKYRDDERSETWGPLSFLIVIHVCKAIQFSPGYGVVYASTLQCKLTKQSIICFLWWWWWWCPKPNNTLQDVAKFFSSGKGIGVLSGKLHIQQ